MTDAPSPVPFDVPLRRRDVLRSLARTLVAETEIGRVRAGDTNVELRLPR